MLSLSLFLTRTASLWDTIELSLSLGVSYYSGRGVKQMKITRGEIQLPFRVLYLKGSLMWRRSTDRMLPPGTVNDRL